MCAINKNFKPLKYLQDMARDQKYFALTSPESRDHSQLNVNNRYEEKKIHRQNKLHFSPRNSSCTIITHMYTECRNFDVRHSLFQKVFIYIDFLY